MSVIKRVGREYVTQIFAFTVALAERLIIPAVFLRYIGTGGFSGWSILVAAAGLIAALEFGLAKYYTNIIIKQVASGAHAAAQRSYREGTTLLTLAVALSTVGILVVFHFSAPSIGDVSVDRILKSAIIPIILASSIFQAFAIRYALYRAHQKFARETVLLSITQSLRVAVTAAAAFVGWGLLGISWAWFGATVICLIVPIVIDTSRQFRGFSVRPAIIATSSRRHLIRTSPGLWFQVTLQTAYTSLPVFALGFLSTSGNVIAQFVLMRTVANFVRQILQMFATVFGLELARRQATDDAVGVAMVYREANQFLAVQTAVATGVIMVLAPDLFALWTGKPELFSYMMLGLAVLPPLLAPAMILSLESLTYANLPWPIIRARMMQLALTAVLVVIIPIDQIGLRFMAALAVGEVVGFGVPLVFAMRKFNPLIRLNEQIGLLLRTAASVVLTVAILQCIWIVPGTLPLIRIGLGLPLGLFALGFCLIVFGIESHRRATVFAAITQRVLQKIGKRS